MNITRLLYYDNPGETLTGFVQGKTASDLEERAARSHARLAIPTIFRLRWNPMAGFTQVIANDPGELEIDFFSTWMGRHYPILLQGEISHFFTAEQAQKDRIKIARINEIFLPMNAHPAIVIPFTELKTQDKTDTLFRNGFVNGWDKQRYYEI